MGVKQRWQRGATETRPRMARWPVFVVSLALGQWLVTALNLRLPVTQHGVWKPNERPFASTSAVVFGGFLFAAALWAILKSDRRWPLRLGALVLLGFALQHGVALLEGRGLDGMRDRIVKTGHAEFAEVAVKQESVWRTLREYGPLVERGELGVYARSKPPGQLLFYMLTERVAQTLNPQPSAEARLEQLRTTAAVLWPLLSCLAIVPLFFFVRRAFDVDRGLLACALYLVVPAVQLITLHTDQVLFPLLTMTAAWLTLEAATRHSLPWAAGAGAVFFLAMFCSFPLGATALVAFATGVGGLLAERQSSGLRTALRWIVLTAAGLAAGMLMLGLVLRLGIGYDFLARYRSAMTFHAAWKRWTPGLGPTLYYGSTNTLEFAFWLGFPLAGVALWRCVRSVAGIRRRRLNAEMGLGAGLLTVLLVLVFFGKTKGEVSRLWLFLVPFACASAAGELKAWREQKHGGRSVAILLLLQALTLLVVKRYKDFR